MLLPKSCTVIQGFLFLRVAECPFLVILIPLSFSTLHAAWDWACPRISYSFVFLLLITHRLTSVGVESVEWSSSKLLLVSLLSHGGDRVMETAYQHFIVRSVCVYIIL